eukprot:gnl/MRDRNA2_/MRDRNA2_80960_c0_seq2.p1 gnl/MRDRNA2_/MRDRNA2_80960_c0~~gnl/MRDRNA2_/MRDRNA2_80960_c0_seq2.p1  ORF type:complete len:141 (+),score=12.11 gnl/MRDRNA2_/MRDRNA2_80960_c0_seq2:51-473(+)
MDNDIQALLALPGKAIPDALDSLIHRHGVTNVGAWADGGRHANHLIHKLVLLGDTNSIACVVRNGIDINTQRACDLCTPLHLALWTGQPYVADCLRKLGADPDLTNRYGESSLDAEHMRNKRPLSTETYPANITLVYNHI